jgi:hypothetical protein
MRRSLEEKAPIQTHLPNAREGRRYPGI